MNREIRDRWVAALRSGDYQQGQHLLRAQTPDGDKLCCLGVLCELAVADGVIPEPVLKGQTWGQENDYYVYGDDEDGSLLPDVVARWADVKDASGAFDDNPIAAPPVDEQDDGYYLETLAGLNDEGKTFGEIAELIESYL